MGELLAKRYHFPERFTQRCGWAVVIGLGIEMIAFGASYRISNLEIDRLQSANLAQAQQIDFLAMQNWPREILFNEQMSKFRDSLKRKPAGRAVILYLPDDVEAEEFASSIDSGLQIAGWPAPAFGPIPPDMLAPVFRGTSQRTELLACSRYKNVPQEL
jgi:hypothetical protein